MPPRFGTDGVRGRAHTELTSEFVRHLGAVSAKVLGGGPFYVGRDTRESGPALEAAFADGLRAAGADAVSLGVVSTPALAWLSAADKVPAAMISASHNPYTDNGVKLFAAGGLKLGDGMQNQIQQGLDEDAAPTAPLARVPLTDGRHLVVRYESALVAMLAGRDLSGLKVVVDCANGSNSSIAEPVLRALGTDVGVLHCAPNGRNINDHCGSTYPEDLQRRVVETKADCGIAFDGDADRLVAVDHRGQLVDGDQIIAICAIDRAGRGELANNTVVVTVMSNLGFRLAMQRRGINVVETAVGDRNVLEALEMTGAKLGGEQSGHVIFYDVATTGDGLLTALQLLDVMQRRATPLADLAAAAMTRLPQVLRNVRVAGPIADLDERLRPAVSEVETALAGTGRVLIRPSGTEPLVRVMVEASSEKAARDGADRLAAAVASLAAE